MFETGWERRPARSGINSTKGIATIPQRGTARGYYLALTFGTLLSSQGADAQRLDPRGLRRWRKSYPTPRPGGPSKGAPPAGLPARAAPQESYVRREAVSNGTDGDARHRSVTPGTAVVNGQDGG